MARRSTPYSGGISPDRTRTGSSPLRHEPRRTPGSSNSGARSIRSTPAQAGGRQGGVGEVMADRKIMLVKPKWYKVSKPIFYAYWFGLGSVVIAVGLVWGF